MSYTSSESNYSPLPLSPAPLDVVEEDPYEACSDGEGDDEEDVSIKLPDVGGTWGVRRPDFPCLVKDIHSIVKIKYKFRHLECARPRALCSRYVVVYGVDMTRKTAVAVPYRQAHLIFAGYVCVDTVLVTYNTVHNIVQRKESVREASRTQMIQGNEKTGRSGYVGIYIPFQGYHL